MDIFKEILYYKNKGENTFFDNEKYSYLYIFYVFREAARECRRKKKEYIKCLENRVAVLENRNQTLIDELKSLKELYQQKTD